ncbi:hypothetical protein D3Z38_19305 [Clostridiales bacterium]|nr:hypothetical protein [Clostridiales bacterium]
MAAFIAIEGRVHMMIVILVFIIKVHSAVAMNVGLFIIDERSAVLHMPFVTFSALIFYRSFTSEGFNAL